jgi:hypothetical protein
MTIRRKEPMCVLPKEWKTTKGQRRRIQELYRTVPKMLDKLQSDGQEYNPLSFVIMMFTGICNILEAQVDRGHLQALADVVNMTVMDCVGVLDNYVQDKEEGLEQVKRIHEVHEGAHVVALGTMLALQQNLVHELGARYGLQELERRKPRLEVKP